MLDETDELLKKWLCAADATINIFHDGRDEASEIYCELWGGSHPGLDCPGNATQEFLADYGTSSSGLACGA